MKAHSPRKPPRLLLSITFYEPYTDQICKMEKALARKPETFQIDLVGSAELSPDTALLIRSILQNRSPQTHLITHARSSLQGGSVLVWLLGDTRLIREDARLFFRRPANPGEGDDPETWKEEAPQAPEMDLEESDYAQVLQHINAYLPVNELAGRPIGLRVLKQFGLVDNERGDRFLASAFARSEGPVQAPPQKPETTPAPPVAKVPPTQI
jgi:hypothetical protein